MSESSTKFLNKDGEVNSIVLDPSNNSAVVKNNDGDTLVKYTNGTWEPTSFAPVDILKDSKSGGIFDSAFKSSYSNLSSEDQNKLSIYTSKNNINNTTVSQTVDSTIDDGMSEVEYFNNQGIVFENQYNADEGLDDLNSNATPNGTVTNDSASTTSKSTEKTPVLTNLKTLAGKIPKGSYPRDPEGFFIGRYPLNQKETGNFDFLKITCYDYEPSTFGSGESFGFKIDDIDKRVSKRRGVVSLPMQPGISEQNSVGWGEDQINPFQVGAGNLAFDAMDLNFEAMREQILASATAAGSNVNEELIKAYFAQQAVGANIIGRATGQVINNNVEVLFNGPNLRTFNYNYKFTPREPKEADHIKKIIRFFKKTMAPKRSTSRIFLKSPDVFKLKYTFRNGDSHPFLNNIKVCALNAFTVDYTPDGSYSTYDDNGGRGDGSMTSYQVGLSFKELTPIYNDDFWNDDEGQEGTGF